MYSCISPTQENFIDNSYITDLAVAFRSLISIKPLLSAPQCSLRFCISTKPLQVVNSCCCPVNLVVLFVSEPRCSRNLVLLTT